MGIEAIGAAAHVGSDDAKFADVEVVEADFRRYANAPVHWLERRVPVEEIAAETQSLVDEFLCAVAEEFIAAWIGGAHIARRRHAAHVKGVVRRGRKIQEN